MSSLRRYLISPSCLWICGALLSFSASTSYAGLLNPSFGPEDGSGDYFQIYASHPGGFSQVYCLGSDCGAGDGIELLGGGYGGYQYDGEVDAEGHAIITPGALFVSTKVTASGGALCLLQKCDAPPSGGEGLNADISFGGYLFVDAPYTGTLSFNMQINNQPVTQMMLPITAGLHPVMPLVVSSQAVLIIDSDSVYSVDEHSASITDIQIAPEPAMPLA